MTSRSEIDRLQNYLDGECTPGEARDIEERLIQEPAFAELLIRLSADEATLKEWSQTQPGTKSQSVRSRVHASRPQGSRAGNRRLIGGVICGVAFAALLVVGFKALLRDNGRDDQSSLPSVEIGRIDELRGDVRIVSATGRTRPARADEMLRSNQKLRTGGNSFARIRYRDAAVFEFGADTTVRFTELRDRTNGTRAIPRLEVESGRMFVTAEKQTDVALFAVRTPHVDIRRPGSRFRVTVTKRNTRVDAHQGDVRMARRDDGKVVDCRAGHFVDVAPHGDLATHRLPVSHRRTIELHPVADAYVTANHPAQSFGTQRVLLAGTSYSSFLKFRIPPGVIRSAELKLHVVHGRDKGWVALADSSNWSEKSITARHHPTIAHDTIAELKPLHQGHVVKATIRPRLLRPGIVTFCLRSNAQQAIQFSSREAGTNMPILVITIENRNHNKQHH